MRFPSADSLPQITTRDRLGQAELRSQQILLLLPHGQEVPKYLHHLLLSWVHQQRDGSSSEQLGQKLLPMQDVDIGGSGLTSYITCRP